MAWTELKPTPRQRAHAPAPCTICCTKGGKKAQRVMIVLRGAPAWFRPGKGVTVSLGTGADQGRLRVSAVGPFTLGKVVGRPPSRPTAALSLPLSVFGLPASPGQRRGAPAEHRVDGDALELTLAAWATAGTKPLLGQLVTPTAPSPEPVSDARKQAAPAPAKEPPPTEKGKPFRGLLAGQPHPGAERRGVRR